MRYSAKLKIATVIVMGCIFSFAFGMITAGSGRHFLSRVVSYVDSAKERVSILAKGEAQYAADVLQKNYIRQTSLSPAVSRSVDTSRLPLKLEVVSLASTPQFAASADLIRGSLTVAENAVLVMDKLGNIFKLEGGTLRRLDYGVFPSGIEKLINNTRSKLPITAVRTLYIAYDKARNTLLVSHQKYNTDSGHVRFTISAIPVDSQSLEKTGDWKTLFETEDIPDLLSFRGATGGKLVISDDTLFFTIGDYNFGQVPKSESALLAQSKTSSFGKIYEHNLLTRKTRLKSSGHRNPQGLVYTKLGELIDAEHGPEGGDELNIIRDGKNYGWPFRTYGTDFGTFEWPISFNSPVTEFSEPMYAWVPSVAISSVIEIRDFSDRWDGDLLAGSLKAQSLFRLKTIDGRVIFSEPIWIGHRIRDLAQHDGKIILMTDDPALVILSIDEQRLNSNSKMQKNVEFIPALATCLNCHHFGETTPSHAAPTLANIIGKRVASDSFDRYSASLKRKGGVWDEDSLAKFIRSPGEFASGSTMPSLGLSPQQVKEVVSALGQRKLN